MKTTRKQRELDKFRAEFAEFQEQTAPSEFNCTRKFNRPITPYGGRSELGCSDDTTTKDYVVQILLFLIAVGIGVTAIVIFVWGLLRFATSMAAHGQ